MTAVTPPPGIPLTDAEWKALLDTIPDTPPARRPPFGPWNTEEFCCPGCGFDMVHITGMRETEWSDYAPAGSDDATWLPMRNGALILTGHCEAGCEIEIAVGQHKGVTNILARTRTQWRVQRMTLVPE